MRLLVADLSQSIDYYEATLGLRAGARTPDAATLTAEDGRALVELQARPGVRSIAQSTRLGLFHFAILVPDRPSLGRFLRHVTSMGVRIGAADHSVSEALYLWDPDGLGIEVYADRPPHAWHATDQQLVMTTDPLDFEDVLAAGEGRPWTGMPAGARLGHVHLSVDDLGQAEGFYHSALGFDKTVWNYPGALFLSVGGYHHHLGTNVWSAGSPKPASDEAQLVHWELILPSTRDVDQAASSLAEAGYPLEHQGTHVVTADPWATRLRLSARQPRATFS